MFLRLHEPEASLKIAKNSVVSIHYKLTDGQGTELDSSAGGDPLVYMHGVGNIISGLEDALTGREKGDELEVTVPPEDGYGPVLEQLVQKVPHSAFQGVDDIQPGMQFQAQSPDGSMRLIRVAKVEDDGVVIDANHPLAGETLHFEVSVSDVREATAEEIEHGHAHGDGGHDH